jgi:hypothetical protein
MNPRHTRLSVNLPTQLHDALREIAGKYNVTMTFLIMQLVIEYTKRELDRDKVS